eukprot:TCONS_00059091-protein
MACEVYPDQTQQQKIQSLQHSIAFLQSQHATTLSSLHQEIERLQKKCKDLTNQVTLSVPSSEVVPCSGPQIRRDLEDEIKTTKRQNRDLLQQSQNKDKRIQLLEGQLRSKEQKYHADLKNIQRRIAELEHELENKANTIVYLTSTIQQKKSKKATFEGHVSNHVLDEQQQQQLLSNVSSNAAKSRFSPTPPPPIVMGQTKRRDYNLRRSGVSPSPSRAGIIQDGSSHPMLGSDYVLQNTLPKTNSTRISQRYSKQSNLEHSKSNTKRDKEFKLANHTRPKPPDYEDFIKMSQPEVIRKSSAEPLPPITTRSGRQLREPVQTRSRVHRHVRPTASALGEVETVIMDSNLSSPERTIRTSLQNSTK